MIWNTPADERVVSSAGSQGALGGRSRHLTCEPPYRQPEGKGIVAGDGQVHEPFAKECVGRCTKFLRSEGLLHKGASMRTALTLLAALVILAIAVPARAADVRTDGDTTKSADTSKTTVEVRNQAFLDAVVYVVRDGFPQRLGIATGNTTARFVLPAYLIRGLNSFKFIIHPIGGRRNSVTDEVLVSRGDVIELTIPPF